MATTGSSWWLAGVGEEDEWQPVGAELEQARGFYSAWINGGAYNEEVCGCSSAAVRRSNPAVGASIGAVATPAAALPAIVLL
jgi:hypothetical protein